MPVRVVTTGLPQVRIEDSGTPLTEGLSRAADTLLQLGPRLAEINMQRENRTADRALRERELNDQAGRFKQEMGLRGRELAAKQQEINATAQWRKAEAGRIDADAARKQTEAQLTGKAPLGAKAYAPGIMGRIRQSPLGGILGAISPEAGLSEEAILRQKNMAPAAALADQRAGANQTKLDVAQTGADARTTAAQTTADSRLALDAEREKFNRERLAHTEADKAVQAAMKMYRPVTVDMNTGVMTENPPPDFDAIRQEAFNRVMGIAPQPAAAPMDPKRAALVNALKGAAQTMGD